MEENQESGAPAEPTPEEPAAPPGDPTKPANKLLADVATAIAERSPTIRQRVVDNLCEDELKKRETALMKCITKRSEVLKELSKLQASGTKHFTRDRKPMEMIYDKKTIDDISKKEQELNKIETAMAKALGETPDYGPAKQIAGN